MNGKINLAPVNTGWLHHVARYVHSCKASIETRQFVKIEHKWFAKSLGGPNGHTIDSYSFQTQVGNYARATSALSDSADI